MLCTKHYMKTSCLYILCYSARVLWSKVGVFTFPIYKARELSLPNHFNNHWSILQFLLHKAMATPVLRSEITDKEIADIAQNCLKSWEELSPYMGLDEVVNETIRRTPGGYLEQKKEFLQECRRRKGSGALFGALIRAARDANNIDLAERLEKLPQHQSGMYHLSAVMLFL